jgi:hypothetical protein
MDKYFFKKHFWKVAKKYNLTTFGFLIILLSGYYDIIKEYFYLLLEF